MLVTLRGIIMLVNPLQPENAPLFNSVRTSYPTLVLSYLKSRFIFKPIGKDIPVYQKLCINTETS